MKRVYLKVTPESESIPVIIKTGLRLFGLLLTPIYYWIAKASDAAGIQFTLESLKAGVQLLPNRLAKYWLLPPVILTRFFEFDLAWKSSINFPAKRYLDISSPYAFPILFLKKRNDLRADFVNPDKTDLNVTQQLVQAAKLGSRSQFYDCLIQDAPFTPNSFDIITSISVVEHIIENKHAIEKIWQLLKPGGKLILTVPCAAECYEVHVNINNYGLYEVDNSGNYFLEYVYDEALLNDWIFSVTGRPTVQSLYGEKQKGWLHKEIISRWNKKFWKFWREPNLMAEHFQEYSSIADLPGEGVISMEFIKRG